MAISSFQQEKFACAYFFMAPTLVYGIFTARLPAFRTMLNLDDAQIGYILLCLGGATLAGLIACGILVDRFGPRKIIGIATLWLLVAITLACLASSYWEICLFCLLAGFSVGFCDVALNAQGISVEQHYRAYCLSFLHGCGSLGGALGALSAALCVEFGLSPFWNMAAVMLVYASVWPLAFRKMGDLRSTPQGRGLDALRAICMTVYLCAMLSMVCHIVEGSVAEWGSLLLNTVKGASQDEAALVFAAFTGAMVCARFGTDNLRRKVGHRWILGSGALISACGMALALISPWPALCLTGYGIMGFGIAPIAPSLFSLAGAAKCATPGQTSGIVSIFAYAGLLLFPPFLGLLGQHLGLVNALWLIVGLCLLFGAGGAAIPGPSIKNGAQSQQ